MRGVSIFAATTIAPAHQRPSPLLQAVWKGTAFWVFWGLAAVAFMQFLSRMHGAAAGGIGRGGAQWPSWAQQRLSMQSAQQPLGITAEGL